MFVACVPKMSSGWLSDSQFIAREKQAHGWVQLQCCRARIDQKEAAAACMREGAVVIFFKNDVESVKPLVGVIMRE